MNASIRPPAGVCTGDYSKFIELQNPSFSGNDAAARSSTPAKPQAADAVPQAALLHGIITAEQLQRAMAASPDGIAHLAPTARLTPLAQDLAREQPDKIHRASANAQSAIRHSPSAIAPPWLWWADGHCPAVQALTSQMRDRLAPLPQPRTHTGLLETVRVFQQRIREGQAVGGILFVESAALAMAYVNHCPSLRGVVAAHDETIEQGIRELGANVLVVEYPRINAQAITDRVTRFIAQPPNPPPTVLRELKMLRLMPE